MPNKMVKAAKTIFRTIVLIIFSLVIIEITCIWWQYHRAIIVIVNNSGREVSDLKIEMGKEIIEIGGLSAGAKECVRVSPQGESSFSISFIAPEKKLIHAPGSYIKSTGGYKVTLTIAPDWTVSNESKLARGCIILPIYKYFHSK